ncbi:MAG: hypothetical protein D6796_08455 [Caldilineae bacterium]|nr:MAG: hypothetical protein D6796_08455 [Caldilineae bacterium]
MTGATNSEDRTTRWLRRIARGWSVVVLAFAVAILAGHLIGGEEPGTVPYPPIENVMPALMVVSMLGLAIAWRWERTGGAINVGAFLAVVGIYRLLRGRFFPLSMMLIFLAAIAPGVLFLIAGWRSRPQAAKI